MFLNICLDSHFKEIIFSSDHKTMQNIIIEILFLFNNQKIIHRH